MTTNNYAVGSATWRKRMLLTACLLVAAGLLIGCDQPEQSIPSLGVAHSAPARTAQFERQPNHAADFTSATPAPGGPPDTQPEPHHSNGDDITIRIAR